MPKLWISLYYREKIEQWMQQQGISMDEVDKIVEWMEEDDIFLTRVKSTKIDGEVINWSKCAKDLSISITFAPNKKLPLDPSWSVHIKEYCARNHWSFSDLERHIEWIPGVQTCWKYAQNYYSVMNTQAKKRMSFYWPSCYNAIIRKGLISSYTISEDLKEKVKQVVVQLGWDWSYMEIHIKWVTESGVFDITTKSPTLDAYSSNGTMIQVPTEKLLVDFLKIMSDNN